MSSGKKNRGRKTNKTRSKKTRTRKGKVVIKKKKIVLIENSSSDEMPIGASYEISSELLGEIPWTEKYRPTNINDIIVDQNIKQKINKIVEEKTMPDIIITGVPGIGKTTTILCLAKKLLGKYMNDGIIELNASDDRGIKAVHESIVYFCKKKFEIDENDGKYAKHKIILLDEADNMTKKAQQLINRLMDEYHHSTRFAFTCNNSSDIIEAIQSRCDILRYRRVEPKKVTKRLQNICEKEKVKYTKQGIESIVSTAQGDMRRAINSLQLIHNGYGLITVDNVYKLCDIPHPKIIKDIFKHCDNKEFEEALALIMELIGKGYSESDISTSMMDILKSITYDELEEDIKIKFLVEIGKARIIIGKGINTPLQLTGCIAKLCL